MPTYRAEDANGRVIELEGDHQPSDAEIAAEFAKLDTGPNFTSENAKDAAGNAEVQGGGRAAAFKALGDAWKHNGPDEVMAGLHDFFKAKGMDETAAAIHRGLSGAMVSSLPVTGPLAVAGALMAPIPTALAIGGGLLSGKAAEKGAEFVGAGPGMQAIAGDVGNIVGGGVASGLKIPRLPGGGGGSVAGREAAAFMRARGVPVDAAVASDNRFVKGAQALADRTLGGSLVATPANAARDTAMKRVGGELAAEVSLIASTPETAGQSLRSALDAKITGHRKAATSAYDELAALEADPAYRMPVSRPKTPADALSPTVRSEVRQIFHELDAKGYERGRLVTDDSGKFDEYVRGSRGADVYHDLEAQMTGTSVPTRGEVQDAVDAFLAGGKPNRVTDAAIQVAKHRARMRMQGGGSISSPPGGQVLTPAEAAIDAQPKDMGLPVDLAPVKSSLRPLYEELRQMMPVAQQQNNAGLKAIENILDASDQMPLSMADKNLSAIKKLARERGGVAKVAVSQLEKAVQSAVDMAEGAGGVNPVRDALNRGRQATIEKYATADVADRAFGAERMREPVRAIASIISDRDASIEQLRTIAKQTPQQVPTMARAWLADTFERPQAVSEWRKLGPETKRVLFPKTADSLDKFFNAMDRISKTETNPSGSGHQISIGVQIAALLNPSTAAHTAMGEAAMAAISKMARSPIVVDRLTRVATLKAAKAPAPVMRAAVLQLTQALRAGATEGLPMAAESQDTPAGIPAGAGR